MAVTPRFTVNAEFSKGKWVNVYKGNNEAEAIRVCNFWDERVNVTFVDAVREQLIAQVEEQRLQEAEQARYESLTITERFAEADARVKSRIEASYQKAIAKLSA